MYNSIVVTNAINCNKQISVSQPYTYKFSLVFDIINWQTVASLKILNKEYLTIFPGDMFIKTTDKLAHLWSLPFDPEGKVYDGPELKIRLADKFETKIWSNITNTKCEYDRAFKIPNLYVSQANQSEYDTAIAFLVKLSDIIFADKISK